MVSFVGFVICIVAMPGFVTEPVSCARVHRGSKGSMIQRIPTEDNATRKQDNGNGIIQKQSSLLHRET